MRVTGWILSAALGAVAAPPDVAAQGTAKAAFERIDAHVHIASPPEAFLRTLDRLRIRLLNVTVVDPTAPGFDKPEPQTAWAAQIANRSAGRIAWASPLDPSGFESPSFAERESARLARSFEQGAVAVKIYKSVGMHLQSETGRYLMPDDLALSPVLDMIAKSNKTLLAHLGEPRSSWRPLDPADPHYGYYKANPAWHMYQHPEKPAWESIMAARDRMLAAHPNLRVVGAHLGSLEHDLDEVAKRLEKYPNFAVDTAARLPDIMRQPREKVRAFMVRYQDRVLWGTDMRELAWSDPAETARRWQAVYERDWKFFASAETMQAGGRTVQGLALPETVLRRIFRENALRWMPGLRTAIARQEPLVPSAEEVLARYVRAMGGEAALAQVTTRVFRGSISVSTYGARGEYEEYAKAPDRFVRIFRFPGYASIERGFDGRRAWEESPEYGIETLAGDRLAEVRRQAAFHPALQFRTLYAKFAVQGRDKIDGQDAIALRAIKRDGGEDTLWFDSTRGLLLGLESHETFANGVRQRVLHLFEDYQAVDGVQVAHGVRYESPRLIWVLKRQVTHHLPLEDSRFRPPDERR